jgi:hypothetical protein
VEIKRGHYRIVLVFKNFVIKFPRIYFWSAIRIAIWAHYRGKEARSMVWKISNYNHELTIPKFLLKGIIDNWHECLYFKKTRSAFLVPTYFTFFGLFNIQARALPWDYNNLNHYGLLYDLTRGEVSKCGHDFEDEKNFGIHKNRLKMLDYGSEKTQKILEKYSKQIEEGFKIKF